MVELKSLKTVCLMGEKDLSKLLPLITEVWRGLMRGLLPTKRREKCVHLVPKRLHQACASHVSFVRPLILFLAALPPFESNNRNGVRISNKHADPIHCTGG